MNKELKLFGILIVFALLTSCGVNSNMMFKEPVKDEKAVNSDSIPLIPSGEYTISVNDNLTFTLSTNEGAQIIEGISGIGSVKGGQAQGQNRNMMGYLVRKDGKVELPVVGKIHVEGLTIEQCEDTLENIFSEEYIDPFVQVRVTNRRAIIFPGSGSDAKVVSLDNPNTTLMEVIANAGGIPDRGKANSIKIMRKLETGEREIYRVDLSKIEGLKFADMIIQSNDYIYVDPRPELAKEIRDEIVPVFSLFSTVLVIFTAVMSLK
jgi:polysaccharide export outer membrane protein